MTKDRKLLPIAYMYLQLNDMTIKGSCTFFCTDQKLHVCSKKNRAKGRGFCTRPK